MTLFQLLMLGASAFFAYKIYEHIQTLQDPKEEATQPDHPEVRTAEAFSTFNPKVLIETADAAREKGDLDKALAIYSEANIKSPNSAEVLFKMGYTLALQERDDEALEYLHDSIKIDDANPFAYVELYKIYKKRDENEKAELYHNKAIEIDENFRNI